MKPLKSLVSQIESLQHGINDLNRWLDDAETLLDSHRVDGNINSVEERQNNHTVSITHQQRGGAAAQSHGQYHTPTAWRSGKTITR